MNQDVLGLQVPEQRFSPQPEFRRLSVAEKKAEIPGQMYLLIFIYIYIHIYIKIHASYIKFLGNEMFPQKRKADKDRIQIITFK